MSRLEGSRWRLRWAREMPLAMEFEWGFFRPLFGAKRGCGHFQDCGGERQIPPHTWRIISRAASAAPAASFLPVILPKRHDRKALNHTHGANHRCYCCHAAACSSASKRQSQQGACLAKVEPRAPRHERRRVAVADVAEKIRFHMPFREKLLLARLTFARRKELLIEFCVIKA